LFFFFFYLVQNNACTPWTCGELQTRANLVWYMWGWRTSFLFSVTGIFGMALQWKVSMI